jgi:hypothetical protein
MMLAARRCILAQDQALFWADSEIAYLRWKWDDSLQRVQDLEMEREDLLDQLEESHERNGELVQLGLAAAAASTERDARRIATLGNIYSRCIISLFQCFTHCLHTVLSE